MHQDVPINPATEDRRKENSLQTVLILVQQIHTSQLALDAKFTKHISEETAELAHAISKLMAEAFPEGDPDGHRRHHELVIAAAAAKAKFWNEMVLAGAKWLGLGVVVFIFAALWAAFKLEVHK